jgi:hypothetical protein
LQTALQRSPGAEVTKSAEGRHLRAPSGLVTVEILKLTTISLCQQALLLAAVILATGAFAAPPMVYKDRAFVDFFRRTNGIVASDGAFSIPLSDGRVIWLFGDCYVDSYRDGTVPCLFQARNAAMVHHRDDLQQARALVGQHKGFKSLFKMGTNEDLWFWPVAGFHQSNTVYVYLSGLRKAGSGPLGFASAGQDYWGKLNFPELEVTEYKPLPPLNGIDFGAGFVHEADTGQTYAFGHKRKGMTLSLYVARFSTANPEGQWTFWNGKKWSSDVTNAAVIASQPATSMSVCKIKNKFLLTSSEFSVGCDQGKEIYVSTSAGPTGPFVSRKTIFTIDDTQQGHYPFFYLPVAHPEFINERNELLITYCINGYEPCLSSCVKGRLNADFYRPRAVRVPLALVDKDY